MTSEVSEDAERASPANTQAHKTTNVYHRHESETVLTLVSFSRREEEEKKSSFHQKLSVVFCLFLLVPRSSLEKKKLTVPLSVPSPLVVLRRAQLTDFYMFPLGTMCEKGKERGATDGGECVRCCNAISAAFLPAVFR